MARFCFRISNEKYFDRVAARVVNVLLVAELARIVRFFQIPYLICPYKYNIYNSLPAPAITLT